MALETNKMDGGQRHRYEKKKQQNEVKGKDKNAKFGFVENRSHLHQTLGGQVIGGWFSFLVFCEINFLRIYKLQYYWFRAFI